MPAADPDAVSSTCPDRAPASRPGWCTGPACRTPPHNQKLACTCDDHPFQRRPVAGTELVPAPLRESTLRLVPHPAPGLRIRMPARHRVSDLADPPVVINSSARPGNCPRALNSGPKLTKINAPKRVIVCRRAGHAGAAGLALQAVRSESAFGNRVPEDALRSRLPVAWYPLPEDLRLRHPGRRKGSEPRTGRDLGSGRNARQRHTVHCGSRSCLAWRPWPKAWSTGSTLRPRR